MNGNPEETASVEQTTPAEAPKPTKKPRTAEHRPHVAASKARSGKKPSPARKATKGTTSAKSPKKATNPGHSGKTAKVLDLLKRPGGATLKELMKTTGWQSHSVRGFLSGVLGKRMGLKVTSAKAEDKERRYSVKG